MNTLYGDNLLRKSFILFRSHGESQFFKKWPKINNKNSDLFLRKLALNMHQEKLTFKMHQVKLALKMHLEKVALN